MEYIYYYYSFFSKNLNLEYLKEYKELPKINNININNNTPRNFFIKV